MADLVVTDHDLVVGTHGRSIYILDDITPLREYKQELLNTAVSFFKPENAIRRLQTATFQYYLSKPVDSVKIEILDSNSVVVNTFRSAKPKADSAKADSLKTASLKDSSANNIKRGVKPGGDSSSVASSDDDDEFATPKPKFPGTKAGVNQYEWDLHYPGATDFPGMILWGARITQGPWALPGKYTVRLTTAGQTISHPFEIKPNPNTPSISMADMKDQFKLATELRDKTSKANETVVQIRNIKTTIINKKIQTPAEKRLVAQLSEIEETLYQVKNESNQDPLNFGIRLNNRLATLWKIVESGDGKPTEGSYQVTKELTAELEKQVQEVKKIAAPRKAF